MKAKSRQSRDSRSDLRSGSTPLSTTVIFSSLCAAIALQTLFFWPNFGNAYTVPKVVAALIGGALVLPLVCGLMFWNAASRSTYRLLALFGFQVLAMTWATANSISPAVSFWGGDWRRMGWITQFAMMVVALAVPIAISGNVARWKFLLRFIAAVGFISAAYGLLQWLGWDPFLPEFLRGEIIQQFGGRYRSAGTIGQPTYFGNYLLYPFFSSLALLWCERGWVVRVMAGVAIAVIGASVIFATASRSSVLGCGVAIAVFGAWFLSAAFGAAQRASTKKVVCIALGLFALSIAIATPRLQTGRFATFGTDSDSIGRIILWRDVRDRVLPHVWIHGTGPGMFRVAFARYRSADYSAFGPDVHWETAHNVFLDRFSEQGIGGLLAFVAMIGVFSLNMIHAVRSATEWKTAAGYAAIASGMAAAVSAHMFNGEVIPTAFYFYLWIGLSVAALDCARTAAEQAHSQRRPAGLRLRKLMTAVAIMIGAAMLGYAERNWRAEVALGSGMKASDAGDAEKLLAATKQAQGAMPQVGTYHLEFASLTVQFLLRNRNSSLQESARNALTRSAIDAALWGVERTDKPMLALLQLVSLGDMTSDGRTEKWLQQLKETDPYWFRPHELSSRLLLRQGKVDEALKEVTLARQLAPYVESTTNLWRQLNTVRREFGSALK